MHNVRPTANCVRGTFDATLAVDDESARDLTRLLVNTSSLTPSLHLHSVSILKVKPFLDYGNPAAVVHYSATSCNIRTSPLSLGTIQSPSTPEPSFQPSIKFTFAAYFLYCVSPERWSGTGYGRLVRLQVSPLFAFPSNIPPITRCSVRRICLRIVSTWDRDT